MDKLTAFSGPVLSRHDCQRITKTDLGGIRDFRGVIVLKYSHGGGKTQYVGKPFRDAKRPVGGRFLAICHRQTLTSELARRLDSRHYHDLDPTLALSCDAIASCVNSVPKFDGNLGNAGFNDHVTALYIDEFSQVRRHIATGSVPENLRESLLKSFVALIARADCVVVTDADMSDEDIRFLEQCRPGERFHVFEGSEEHGHLKVTYEYGKDAANKACADILARLENGARVIVATDSLKKVERLIELVENELPHIKAIGITARNKDDPPQKAFIV